jgi:hypothetical protein
MATKRGMIDVPRYDPKAKLDPPVEQADMVPTAVDLPPPKVIEAGVEKFMEMANLYWPARGGVITFDPRNKQQLRMTLGLVYLAMMEAAVD